jgi:hypothetical protein
MVESLQRLAALPQEQKLPALGRALDLTAEAGLGDDAFGVLARELTARPLDTAVDALDIAVREAGSVAPKAAEAAVPLADEAMRVAAPAAEQLAARVAAPVADDVARVVEAAVPQIVERTAPAILDAVMPAIAQAAGSRSLLVGGGEALHAAMPFASAVDDTLRLLTRIR